MLKQSVLAKVYAALEKSPFTVADFIVQTGDDDADPVLMIEFRHDKRFYFAIRERGGVTWAIESPGEYKKQESVQLESLQKLPERVLNWARNVRDELRALLPAYAELDALRESIERHIEEHVTEPDAPFSEEEAEVLRSKLDALVAKFTELAEQSEITKQELNRLDQELTALKANLGSYSKSTWYKTAGTKLWAVTSKIVASKESRELIAQAARKAIGLDPP